MTRIGLKTGPSNSFSRKCLYSDRGYCSELELIVTKYSRAVFTNESAYYYYELTDATPDYFNIEDYVGMLRHGKK